MTSAPAATKSRELFRSIQALVAGHNHSDVIFALLDALAAAIGWPINSATAPGYIIDCLAVETKHALERELGGGRS